MKTYDWILLLITLCAGFQVGRTWQLIRDRELSWRDIWEVFTGQ